MFVDRLFIMMISNTYKSVAIYKHSLKMHIGELIEIHKEPLINLQVRWGDSSRER